MARQSRPSQRKRQRELALQQKRQSKMARRFSKDAPGEGGRPDAGEDPDIAGIRPGPQPLPEEWADLPPTPADDESSKS